MKDSKPWKPVEFTDSEAAAVQALAAGNANEGQQQMALKWIIEKAGFAYQQSYFPGDDGRRDTDFAEGRRFVANTIIKLTKWRLGNVQTK